MKPKTKTLKPPTIIGKYTKNMDQAIKNLNLAISYAEDGAQFDAIKCAAEAIGLLGQAHMQRDKFLNSLTQFKEA